MLRLLRQQTLREEDPVMRTALSAGAGHWTLEMSSRFCEIFSIRCLSGFPHLKSIIRTLCKMDIYYLTMVSPPKIVTLVLSAKLMINWGFVQQKSLKTQQWLIIRTNVPILDGFAYLGPFPNILNFHEISLTASVGTVSGRISADACHACHLKTSSHKSIQSITGLHHTANIHCTGQQNSGQLKNHIHKHQNQENWGSRYFWFWIVH